MASTNKTVNYNLSQFSDDDKPSWRGDYNGDMTRIDKAIDTVATATTTNQKRIEEVDDKAKAAQTSADKAQKTAQEGVDSANSAQSSANNALNILGGAGLNSANDGTQMRDEIRAKADTADVYSRTQADSRFATKVELNGKADSGTSYTKSESDLRFMKVSSLQRPNIIAIGDSFGQGYGTSDEKNKNLYAVMGSLLNANVFNYSVGGSGFIHTADGNTADTYTGQLNRAKAEHSANADDINYVVVTGGQNDNKVGDNNVISAMRNFFVSAHAYFKNAEIIYYPMQYGANPLPMTLYALYAKLIREAQMGPWVRVIRFGYTALRGRYDLCTSSTHPNDQGAYLLGHRLADIVQGSSDGDFPQLEGFRVGPNVTLDGENWASYEGGIISLRGAIKAKEGHADWTMNEKVCWLPSFCKAVNPTGYFPGATTSGELLLMGINNETDGEQPTLIIGAGSHANNELIFNVTLGPTF